MGIFKRLSASKTAVSTPQTQNKNPFSTLDRYIPLSDPQTRLYRELREGIPVIDAAICKIVRLTGGFKVNCPGERAERELEQFLSTVPVGGNQQGVYAFVSTYFEQLLTFGTAVGEIVTDGMGNIAALYNANIDDVELKRD